MKMRVCNRPDCGNGPLDDVCEVCRAKDAGVPVTMLSATQMLEAIVASLRAYPFRGCGDVRVMTEVERIEREAYNRGFNDRLEGELDSGGFI